MPLDDAIDHPKKSAWIELGLGCHLRTGDPEALLQVLFIADDDIDILDDPPNDLYRAIGPAGNIPELLPEVEVERNHGAGGLGGLHAFDDQLGRGRRERREDSAAVEPAHAFGENRLPVKVAWL